MIAFFKTQLGFSILLAAVLVGFYMTCAAYCILLERKVAAWVQDRRGPNRVGPAGLLQPLADGLKFLFKEDIVSANVDRPVFLLAPAIAFVVAMVGFAVIPWAGRLRLGDGLVNVQVASVDIGLLYILAVGAISVYGVVLGGWASNNKFSFYGGMRAAAQLLSYEIPMGLAILVVVITSGQVRLEEIVAGRTGQLATTWNILLHPAAFLILLITAFAETNRTPFDLAEAEQELIDGYLTEYSSMKLAMFYLGEYAHMITASAFMVVLFLGGWEPFPLSNRLADWLGLAWLRWLNHDPAPGAMLLRFGVTLGKIGFFVLLFMWVRWTVPRFRFDQLMRLAWGGLVPIALALVAWTGVLVYVGRSASVWAPIGDVAILAVILAWLALAKPQPTGRQRHLPPVPGSLISRF